MSKIPVDRNGKTRSLEIRNAYPNEHTNIRSYSADIKNSYAIESRSSVDNHKNDLKEKIYFKPYTTLIPKINFNMDKVVDRNPRILDLREKLNEISKKQEMNVDKKTKSLLNDITQQLVEDKEGDDSGPYSLLFDIHSPSTSSKERNEHSSRVDYEDADLHSRYPNKSPNSIIAVERLPNVLNFDNKPMNEFEYSCEKEFSPIHKKTFNTHSRSDLCLQLKSHIRNIDTNSSPNENSMTRNNEENSLDDSLGILTPDQMDDICYLENSFSPTVEGLPIFCENNEYKVSPDNGDTPSTDKTESNSAASTIQNDCYENTINLSKSSVVKENFAPIATIDAIEITSCDNDVLLTYSNNLLNHPDGCSPQNILLKEECINIGTESCQDISVSEVLEEEFLPSIHGSILEPASSMADTTVNMEIPLDVKNGMPVITNRIEQTPSPEDLPLDNSDVNGEISTYSQFSSSTLHDSQTYSDSKSTDYTKSMETSKVSNSFITSITSITSLDGYQGDGEMSRPVSRSAEHNLGPREEVIDMDWQNIAVPRRVDPMTDSDFFTESDADGFDEQMQRGDRRAQVIDGALYGGKNKKSNQPLIVNRSEDSCMESSGLLRFRRARIAAKKKLEDIYYTPLNNHLNNTLEESDQNIPCLLDDDNITPKNTSKRNSIKSDKSEINACEKNKEEKRSFTLKKYKMPKRDVPSKLKTMLQSRKSEVDNNVQNSPKAVKKTERRESFLKKNVIDSKTDYRVKSYKDIKSKVDCSFSLQRSQTSCSVTRMMSSKSQNQNAKPKSRHMRMRLELGSAHGSGKSSLHSSQSDISATSSPAPKHTTARFPLRNGKKREPSTPATRTPTASTPQPPPTQAKKNGVVQKLSSSPVAVRPRTSLAPPPSPRKPVPHRTTPQRPTTLPATKEPPRVATAVGPRGKRAQTPQQAARSPPAALPAPTPAPLVPLTAASTEQADALAHAAKGVEALGVLVQYLVFRLDALNGSSWRVEAERWRGVAAAERSSAARADRDRQQRAQKDLDTIAECLSKISELEMEVSSKEEANARLQATHIEEVSALANDVKGLKDTIDSLKHEVAESRTRLHAHSEIERTLRAQLAAARDDVDQDPGTPYTSGETGKKYTCDAACDPICWEAEECELRIQANEELSKDATELAAEVRSLRSVVELKQAEVASLRDSRSELAAERERRAAAERDAGSARQAAEELRERGAARQREVDRLRDDNRRLREVAARDRDHAARLLAHNEELRYKLRQKSQVVSLLAGGAYVERSGSRPHTCSSGDSSPPASPPASPSSSPSPLTPPLPAVKGVVEKHDSVSWVLEIEETPEEMASRLARKSSFRSSTSSGVKRRGEGSPAPASPAPNASKLFRPGDMDFPPPPPPLKEAAGEAIYIYDEGHY
ncbi:unnamed protein product [Pieris brassicae]|uniref:Uncharacterized protein n=1 Tax=Pieris brassicae TaxID=7116 RepID=A0A9P0SK60_PIEBR|nr:unnamed protein product [Pieris brassicae]